MKGEKRENSYCGSLPRVTMAIFLLLSYLALLSLLQTSAAMAASASFIRIMVMGSKQSLKLLVSSLTKGADDNMGKFEAATVCVCACVCVVCVCFENNVRYISKRSSINNSFIFDPHLIHHPSTAPEYLPL